MAFNQNAYDFVVANLDNPFAIAAAMAELGISSSQLADAIGVDTAAVNSFLSNAGVAVANETGAGFVDTSPVDTGPVSSEPAYTQEQYQDAGQFIAQNIDKPEVIAQVAQDLGLSTQDILTAVQTVNQDITKADVENYLTKATSTVDTGPVDTGPVDTSAVDVSTPSSTPKTTLTSTTITDAENNTYDRETILKLAQQVSQNFDASKSSGGAYGVTVDPDTTIGFKASDVEQILGKTPTSAQMVIFDIARGLASQGVTDVSELAKYKPTEITEVVSGGEGSDTTQVVTKYIDPDTNKEISLNLGSTYAGEGGTQYVIDVDPSGTAKFVTVAEDTSDAGTILPIISLALMAVPVIGQSVGTAILGSTASAATATAVGNAIINSAIQIAAGVEPEKAIGSAAASIFGSQATPAISSLINESLGNVQVSNIIAKAVEGGVKAVLTDQDVGKSAVASLTGQALGSVTQQMIDDPATARQIASAVSMGTSSAIGGGDVATSVIAGLIQGSNAVQKQVSGATSGAPTKTSEPSSAGPNLTEDLPDNILKPITLTPEEIASQGRSIAVSPDSTVTDIVQDPVLQQVINDAVDADNRSLIADTFAKYQSTPATPQQVEAWVQWAKSNPNENLVQAIETGYQNAGIKPISEGTAVGATNEPQAKDTAVDTGAPGSRIEISAPSEPVLTGATGSLPTDAEVLNQVIADRGAGVPVNAGAVTVTAPKESITGEGQTLPTDTTTSSGLPTKPIAAEPVVVTGKPEINAGTVTVTGKKDILETDPVVVQSTKLNDQPEPVVVQSTKLEDATEPVVVTGKPEEDLLPTDTEILDIVKEDLKPEALPEDLLPTTLAPRRVRPGTRVVEDTGQILPLRPGLSEGYLGDIEGTPEEKQQPVWNVRSLKLRRLLGI